MIEVPPAGVAACDTTAPASRGGLSPSAIGDLLGRHKEQLVKLVLATVSLVILSLFTLPSHAQTSVSGDQSDVWSVSGSPFLVTGDVTVPSGQTLTIEPGVVVSFQGYHRLRVQGNLQAEGTSEAGITFTTDSHAVGWHGIRFRDAQNTNRLIYCVIEYGKSNDGDYPDNLGGGVLNFGADLIIDHCRFESNSSVLHGGGLYAINSGQTTVTNTTFTGNHCYMWGGAVCIANSYVDFTDCVIVDNTADYNGAGFYFDSVYLPTLTRCLIARNATSISSGAAINANMSTPFLTNCTITGNQLGSVYARGPALYVTYGEVVLTNCIIYDNQGTGDELHLDAGGTAQGYYSDLPIPSWGFTGDHNITADPLFVDPAHDDWGLSEASPCIDEGTAYLEVEDYYGTLQVTVDLAEDEYSGSAPDMGHAEFQATSSVDATTTLGRLTLRAYPNPFNPMTAIEFSLPDEGAMELAIYDVSGRKVRSLFSGTRDAGTHTLVWDGKDDSGRPLASGVYLMRGLDEGNATTGKLVLAR